MKIRNLSSFVLALISVTAAQAASAQVIILFGAGAISAVPFSPWMTAAMGVMLALVGLIFIRRKTSHGVFFLVLSVVAACGALMQEKEAYAAYSTPTLFQLVTSGTHVGGTTNVAWMMGPVCGAIGYAWVTSGVGTIKISGINYEAGYSALDPANPPGTPDVPLPTPPAPVCTVGTTLNNNSSCVVWYQKPTGGC